MILFRLNHNNDCIVVCIVACTVNLLCMVVCPHNCTPAHWCQPARGRLPRPHLRCWDHTDCGRHGQGTAWGRTATSHRPSRGPGITAEPRLSDCVLVHMIIQCKMVPYDLYIYINYIFIQYNYSIHMHNIISLHHIDIIRYWVSCIFI